ncbi:MAG: RNA methyltransferase [Burkholderiaceae bacterium]|jgi:23S rRNA (adenine2503-C2)-methyltransferase|nr:RNA methyltransferase [Burkholderiales bacterium]MCZ8103198.1 RNA methyltransferase [Burkholderiales bacterium]MCZ8339118.1 RNA methyltransferase [Burkholderiaceae bacterium]
MDLDTVRERLHEAGAAPPHVAWLLRQWLRGGPLDAPYRGDPNFLPKRLRGALPELGALLDGLARVESRHPAADGGERLLVSLAGGATVETVLLPRGSLCVSTQVGCAVGCTFCTTGRDGLLRQLGAAEIVAQVALARRLRAVRTVVFMGMGEPAHNLDAVLDAIALLGTEGGVAHKNLVFSTVGDRRAFERLPQGPVKPALALSLHTTRADLRERLLPRAPRIRPEELVELACAYADATTHPLLVQWTLLDGENDGADEVDALARLLAGRRALLNAIPWNAVDDAGFARPPYERAVGFVRALRERGVMATLRWSAAQDVDGGCGQLRARRTAGPTERPIAPPARDRSAFTVR